MYQQTAQPFTHEGVARTNTCWNRVFQTALAAYYRATPPIRAHAPALAVTGALRAFEAVTRDVAPRIATSVSTGALAAGVFECDNIHYVVSTTPDECAQLCSEFETLQRALPTLLAQHVHFPLCARYRSAGQCVIAVAPLQLSGATLRYGLRDNVLVNDDAALYSAVVALCQEFQVAPNDTQKFSNSDKPHYGPRTLEGHLVTRGDSEERYIVRFAHLLAGLPGRLASASKLNVQIASTADSSTIENLCGKLKKDVLDQFVETANSMQWDVNPEKNTQLLSEHFCKTGLPVALYGELRARFQTNDIHDLTTTILLECICLSFSRKANKLVGDQLKNCDKNQIDLKSKECIIQLFNDLFVPWEIDDDASYSDDENDDTQVFGVRANLKNLLIQDYRKQIFSEEELDFYEDPLFDIEFQTIVHLLEERCGLQLSHKHLYRVEQHGRGLLAEHVLQLPRSVDKLPLMPHVASPLDLLAHVAPPDVQQSQSSDDEQEALVTEPAPMPCDFVAPDSLCKIFADCASTFEDTLTNDSTHPLLRTNALYAAGLFRFLLARRCYQHPQSTPAQRKETYEKANKLLNDAIHSDIPSADALYISGCALFEYGQLTRDSSSMLSGIERQKRAAVLDSKYSALIADVRQAVDDPELLDFYRNNLNKKSMLPVEPDTVTALVAFMTEKDDDEDSGSYEEDSESETAEK